MASFCKIVKRFYRANKPIKPNTSWPGYRNVLDITNPATLKKVGELQEDTIPDIERKLEYLHTGLKRWKLTHVDQRKAALEKFADALVTRKTTLAKILTSETGKPISQARSEIAATVDRIHYFVENCEKVIGTQTVLESSRLKEKVQYEPLGVIANISAWNYPYFLSANVFAPALLTGNCVLYKPSENASLTGQEITDMLHNAGIPEDVFVISSGGADTGSRIAGNKDIGGLFFTGSYDTGLEIAKKASPNLLQLELGGKDAAYIRHDVPNILATATTVADGAFYNAGQSCCSIRRIYVNKRVYVPFMEALKKISHSYRIGDPTLEDTYIGPLCTKKQVEKIGKLLAEAINRGAQVDVGGDTTNSTAHKVGYFVPPTILTDVDHQMSIMRKETFGPVVGVMCVEDDDEATTLMSDTEYGLTASVFSKHLEDAEAILNELKVGTGYWNCCDRVSPRVPWSGRKRSGVGSTMGIDGLRAFVQPKGFFCHEPMAAI
ncbi:hypothetical protein SELMODRAFT_444247 [Selaginella moellendorffii]|uniref:Aldehyde dehydrogenase domain-containing protein n=1 Tax=Selaginella moellendorffii TaxID=88036 RepID=D8S885_SELML|nr:hypothetical protein SELMODRAFT_444247 [Selaginella moellendorffii]